MHLVYLSYCYKVVGGNKMFVRRIPTKADRSRFGDLLRHCREEQHFTQEELAAFLGCSPHWISDIEQGKCNPSWRDAIHLSAIVKLDPICFAEEAGLHVPISTR